MEDIFQILFILIFVISSIVSSMKKKKKTAEKKQIPKPSPVQANRAENPIPKKTSAEVLEEMFGLKVNIPEPYKNEAPAYSDDVIPSPSTWDPTKEYEEIYDDGTSEYQSNISAKKDEFQQNKNKHRAFVNDSASSKKRKIEGKINKLFTSRSDLKDYIIIQEILNKPKSLRR